MLKEKQIELINKAFEEIKSKFPQIELGKISFDNEETWIDILIPDDLFGNEKLSGILSEHGTNILMTYGFSILFLPMPLNNLATA